MTQPRISAGLLMYRIGDEWLEVFLAHPGGPFFRHKDEGHWSIPKGEVEPGEELLAAALREFKEEVGLHPPGPFLELGSIKQKGGKIVYAWAFCGDWDPTHAHVCNQFTMEWPPLSGKLQSFPEIDRVGFFSLPEAREKLKASQHPFLDRLAAAVNQS
ncbi:MAG: NUDIX domain-containing protein [Chloroflexi bacterium]|nr:NUDIX domain-containing protein [Chloroflexota bacterium]